MRGYVAFYRASSIVVLLAMGVWLSPQNALADSFDWRSVNGHNWNSTVKSSVRRDVLGFFRLRLP